MTEIDFKKLPFEIELNKIDKPAYHLDCEVFLREIGKSIFYYDDILNYFKLKIEENYARATIGRYFSSLKYAIKLNCNNKFEIGIVDFVFKDILENISLPPRRRKIQKNYLTEIEISKIIDLAIKDGAYKSALYIKMLYETGCRVSELINIKIRDCYVSSYEVLISVRTCKTKIMRTIKISSQLYYEIRKYWNDDVYLFGNNGKHVSRLSIYTVLRRQGKKHGINLYPHMIRRSYASNNMYRDGIYEVSRYLGHKNIAGTLQDYVYEKPLSIRGIG